MNWALYAIAAYLIYGVLQTVSDASKPPEPRKQLRGSILAGAVAVDAGIITVLFIAAGRLT